MKKIVAFLFFILLSFSQVVAIFINPKIEKLYSEKIIFKIDKKYQKNEIKIKILESLGIKLEKIKKYKKYRNNQKIQNLLDQILYLNEKQIKKYKTKLIFEKLKNKKSQENKNIENFKGQKENNNPKNSEKILEGQEGNKENVYEKKYKEELEKNKKIINSYSYSKYFKNKIYDKNLIFLENGTWYTYVFDTYTYFPENTKIGLNDLDYNGIDPQKALVFVTEKNTLGILKNPTKRRLINNDIIKNLKNKYYFLELVKDDVKKINYDKNYDKKFLELKAKTRNLTYSLSRDSKISNIYNFILKNTSYSKLIDFTNYKLFSGIETYINGDGVCIGYAKLMTYMLLFSDINDVEVIKGYVIDAPDFPEVGHAWVKIGEKYYDPTFDDPSGAEKNKEFKEYKYFGLPKDLFYTNRYETNELPKYIKNLSLKDRKDIIRKNLYNIYSKYKNKNYNLLKETKFRIKYNLKYNEEINFYNFEKILSKKVVQNFAIFIDGQKKYIKSLKYYPIDKNTDFEALLEQLDYNLDGYYFFEWYDENGNKSYKIAYYVVLK